MCTATYPLRPASRTVARDETDTDTGSLKLSQGERGSSVHYSTVRFHIAKSREARRGEMHAGAVPVKCMHASFTHRHAVNGLGLHPHRVRLTPSPLANAFSRAKALAVGGAWGPTRAGRRHYVMLVAISHNAAPCSRPPQFGAPNAMQLVAKRRESCRSPAGVFNRSRDLSLRRPLGEKVRRVGLVRAVLQDAFAVGDALLQYSVTA